MCSASPCPLKPVPDVLNLDRSVSFSHSEGDQPWHYFGRNDAKAETPVLWLPHAKSWLIGKESDAGMDWGQEKRMAEDEMAGRHHRFNGREFEWTQGDGDGQGGLGCCNSWGRRESDTTERLNWTELITWDSMRIKWKDSICLQQFWEYGNTQKMSTNSFYYWKE